MADHNPKTACDQTVKMEEDRKIQADNAKKVTYDSNFLLSFKDGHRDKPVGNKIDEIIAGTANKLNNSNQRNRNRSQQRRGGAKSPRIARSIDPDSWQGQRSVQRSEIAEKLRKVQTILNKITIPTFDILSKEIIQIIKDTNDVSELLPGIINLIFDNALTEPTFGPLYAELSIKLQKQCPTFTDPMSNKPQTVRRILLNNCQAEFLHKIPSNVLSGYAKLSEEERELKIRDRVLGNVLFIAELYKLRMITDKILHTCIIQTLLAPQPTASNIESFCKLMLSIGSLLEKRSNKKTDYETIIIEQNPSVFPTQPYFDQIENLANDQSTQGRLRCLIWDILELRKGGWKLEDKKDQKKTSHGDTKPNLWSPGNRSSGLSNNYNSGYTKKNENLGSSLKTDEKPQGSATVGAKEETQVEQSATSEEETKKSKKIKEDCELLLEEYFISGDTEEAGLCIQDLNDESCYGELIQQAMELSWWKKDSQRDAVAELITDLYDNVWKRADVEKGLQLVFDEISEKVLDCPNCGIYVGKLVGKLVKSQVVEWKWVGNKATSSDGGDVWGKIVVHAINEVAVDEDSEVEKVWKEGGIDFGKLLHKKEANELQQWLQNKIKEKVSERVVALLANSS